MKAYIAGIGHYVPEKILDNHYFEQIVDTSDEWIRTRTGMRERRMSGKDTPTSDLATKAAIKALGNADTKPADLDAIIIATATPDMFFPSTACIVQNNIGAKKIISYDIAAGCTGFLYGLSIADSYIQTGYKNILVIGAEELTKITDYTDRATCVLFGDAAGAAVIKGTEKSDSAILSTYFGADGSYGDLLYMPAGGTKMPSSHETVDEKLNFLKMEGNKVFKVAVRCMADSAVIALERAHVKPEELSLLVPHQANMRIIEATAKRLNLPMEKVAVNLDKYGNTSAASIPLALSEAIQAGRVKQGDLVLMVAFGAGFTWGGVLIRW